MARATHALPVPMMLHSFSLSMHELPHGLPATQIFSHLPMQITCSESGNAWAADGQACGMAECSRFGAAYGVGRVAAARVLPEGVGELRRGRRETEDQKDLEHCVRRGVRRD